MSRPFVMWLNTHVGQVNPLQHWDTEHLRAALLRASDLCWYHGPLVPPEEDSRRAVVFVSGQHHTSPDDVAHINGVLANLERVVLIVHSDEASLFPWWEVQHPALRWWVMTPRLDVHGRMPDGTRFVGEGAGPAMSLPPVSKDLGVGFMGQVPASHASRQSAVAALDECARRGYDVLCEPTDGFMQGRPRAGYLSMLARCKVAVCPSGAATSDSFRLYEAIDLGCVPVVERRTPDGEDHHVWGLMYGDDFPVPVVESWDELPDLLPSLLDAWEGLSSEVQDWWRDVQRSYVDNLRADVAWLSEASGSGATVGP